MDMMRQTKQHMTDDEVADLGKDLGIHAARILNPPGR